MTEVLSKTCTRCGETHPSTARCPERCERTDLYPAHCACKDHRGGSHPAIDGLLIDQFRTARYNALCKVDDTHVIRAGDPIGFAVVEAERPPFEPVGWVCEDCVNAITR